MPADLTAVTEETLNAMQEPMRKALATGYTVGLGLQGYELEAPAKFLVPVLSPWRNRVTRKQATVGSLNCNYRAITGINVGNADPTIGFGVAGTTVQTQETNYAVPYQALALGDSVQMDAQRLAQGFDDLRSRSGINLLFALMIAEDRAQLGHQQFPLATPGTPTVTTATTGGSIAQTTAVHFVVAARTIQGYYFNNVLSTGAFPAAGVAPTAAGGTVTSAD